jgi:hypothetical protein
MGDAESEAGPFANRLGREKRVEDPVADFGRHAASVVDDLDPDALRSGAGYDGNFRGGVSGGFERILGIAEQVDKNLLQLDRICMGEGKVGFDVELKSDPGLEEGVPEKS